MDYSVILSIKWWALLIGVAIHFVVGMLWYGPLFAKPWMALVGLNEEKIREEGNSLVYFIALLTALIKTYVLGVILNIAACQTVLSAIAIGVFVWFGLSLTTLLNHSTFEMRPAKLILINAFHDLIVVVLVSIVLQLAR